MAYNYKTVYRITILLTLFSFLTGCAGRDFVRPDQGSISLGKTTYEDVIQKYGDPRRQGTVTKNGEKMNKIVYSYAQSTPFTTHLSVRTSVFYFKDNILVGYSYSSSFPEDIVKLDDGKVSSIKQEVTTKAEVISLLGNPTGFFSYPLIKEKNQLALVYSSIQTWRIPFSPTPRYITKTLVVSCGQDDIVKLVDVESSEQQ
jgi:hypothetical protein